MTFSLLLSVKHALLCILFLFFLLIPSTPIFSNESPSVPYVLVSVAPHRFFVEKIAGNTVRVGLMVPAGSSAHTFEPTPKQMLEASQAEIWFRIGEPFETKALSSLQNHNAYLEPVDLRVGLDLIFHHGHGNSCCCCSKGGADLHFWTSLRQAKIQARTIAATLIRHYPEHEAKYRVGLHAFLAELDAMDQSITALLKPLVNRTLLVSHPAYAYFCRDYGLTQFSIEFEGKDPTPQQLTRTLQMARSLQTKKVYIQKQYNNKGAQLVAKELGAQLVMLDPYAEDYLNSMHEIALRFSEN